MLALVQILVLKLNVLHSTTVHMYIDAKSSTAKLFSSLKATRKATRLFYKVKIAGNCIFTKSEATNYY